MYKRRAAPQPTVAVAETFLSVAYGTPVQVGRILAIKEGRGRSWAQTSSGIPFIFPIGGPDYAALLDHSGL